MITSSDFEDNITSVLDDINTTGVVGNLSFVPGSLTTTELAGNLDILGKLHYKGY